MRHREVSSIYIQAQHVKCCQLSHCDGGMEAGEQICGQTALRHDSRTLAVSSRPGFSSHLFTEMLTHLDGSLCSCFNEDSIIGEAHGCASPDGIGQHLGIEAWHSAYHVKNVSVH